MKFQLPSLKLIGQLLLTLLIAVIIGTGLLTLAYTIPVDKINSNVADSTYIFSCEGNYPTLSERYISILDNFTDAIMLKQSAYSGNESAFQKALLAPQNSVADVIDSSPADELILYYAHPEYNHTVSTYARYWHGYLIFLKPFLHFMNYGQIRNINMYIQVFIVLALIVLLIIKKNWQLVIPYTLLVLMLRVGLTAYSLQHSTVFYIFSIASILLLLLNKSLTNNNRYVVFFLLLGTATSYFDFLTYPLVSFGIPAALFLFINRETKYCDIRILINILVSWFVGYIGMWASKWILATIFTNQNIIDNAISSIKFRTSSTDDVSNQVTYGMVLSSTFQAFFSTPFSLAYVLFLFIEIITFIIFHIKKAIRISISLVLLATLPLFWYAFTINHSYIHRYLFTYKEWAITTFAISVLFANIAFKKKS